MKKSKFSFKNFKMSVSAANIKTWEQYFFENLSSTCSGQSILYPVDREINSKVSLWEGDITRLKVDAVVNAANERLLGGGGVDGAIHLAAGRNLKTACKKLGGALPGEAKITEGFYLPAKYVIHAVGPRGEDPEKLRQAYKNSLDYALTKYKIRTIAFPCISTGIFGYPTRKAAGIAAETVREFLDQHKKDMIRVIFVTFENRLGPNPDTKIYEEEMVKYFPIKSEHQTVRTGHRKHTGSTSLRVSTTKPSTGHKSPFLGSRTHTRPMSYPTATERRTRRTRPVTTIRRISSASRTESFKPIITSESSISSSTSSATSTSTSIRCPQRRAFEIFLAYLLIFRTNRRHYLYYPYSRY